MLKIYIKLLPLQGVTNERALTQGVASLALGYVLLPFQGDYQRHLFITNAPFYITMSECVKTAQGTFLTLTFNSTCSSCFPMRLM